MFGANGMLAGEVHLQMALEGESSAVSSMPLSSSSYPVQPPTAATAPVSSGVACVELTVCDDGALARVMAYAAGEMVSEGVG